MTTIINSPTISDKATFHTMVSNASILLLCIVAIQRCVEISSNPLVHEHYRKFDLNANSVYTTGSIRESNNFGYPRFNSTARLKRLREEMVKENISAYIFWMFDDHQSRFISEHDKAGKFITGFTGSAGHAVITLKSAALWTDSRYYEQASSQLDSNWILMKDCEKETPTISEWLISQLKAGESVSTDPKICPCQRWKTLASDLGEYGIKMALIKRNLIDPVWPEFEERPNYTVAPVIIIDLKFAGMTWQDKLALIRQDMKKAGIDTLIVTALDEIAWLLNLRGGELPYTPLFRSYMIIDMTRATIYIHQDKVTQEIREHLNWKGTKPGDSVQIADYETVWSDLDKAAKAAKKVGLPQPFSFAGGISYLVCQAIPPEKTVPLVSPIIRRKDYKNEAEVAGMKNSHIRDAVALCQFLRRLEKEVTSGSTSWTEVSAAEVLDGLRSKQKYNMGISFETISAFGENAGMVHYKPTPESDTKISSEKMYLIDSGGQYLDGTTDVTRTVHYGTPRFVERNTYTRLLMGCIDMATTIFRKGFSLRELDIIIRRPLFEAGLDYGHGTTHGIGSFLVVHESFNMVFDENFFGSQEPGYYKENDYGLRLENIVRVVKANISGSTDHDFLTFETVTLVPYERKMIITELLEKHHLEWLNKYHQQVREVVGAEMLRQGLKEEYQWLLEKTEPISK